jgi:succinyl-CoA synthetase beta subunit
LKLQEYRSKEILARHGVPLLDGEIATSPAEARAAAERIGGPVVVKAQVLVGGRGKAGGVKLAHTPEEAFEKARDILALTIKGLPVRKVLVAQAADIAKEYYCAIVMDREKKAPLVMLSAAGGVDIEEVARTAPEKLVRFHVPLEGLRPYMARNLMRPLFPDFAQAAQATDILLKLYRVYTDADCSLAEINPLAVTPEGRVLALDAKVVLDDNADFRHKDWADWRDPDEETAGARLAREKGLSYVKLDGDIGCIVNGAGLAMATMDLIKHYGGEPANFLDIGGSSNPEKVTAALKIITGDASTTNGGVRAILFNIFGGITRCDEVAQGILDALDGRDIGVPIVVRLDGTSDEEGRKLLSDANPPGVYVERTMLDAARRAVELAGAAA